MQVGKCGLSGIAEEQSISYGYYAESERKVDFVIGSAANPVPVAVKYLNDYE